VSSNSSTLFVHSGGITVTNIQEHTLLLLNPDSYLVKEAYIFPAPPQQKSPHFHRAVSHVNGQDVINAYVTQPALFAILYSSSQQGHLFVQ